MPNKPLTLLLFLTVAFCSFSLKIKANHAAGGELIYEWQSDSTYRFYFKFYRDCTGTPAGGPYTLCAKPANCGTVPLFAATLQTMGNPVPTGGNNGTPVGLSCPAYQSKCTSPSSVLPGYEEWWYTALVILPGRCLWTFSVSIDGRNLSVNIASPSIFHVETTLNNQIAQGNSSPFFSVQPIPYVCINQLDNYNNGTIDPNNDSLSYELVQPLVDNQLCPPTTMPDAFNGASPPYNLSNNPFQTNNSYSLNAQTGQITFTPTVNGPQAITIKAKEYRHGVLIGSVSRDVQIQVLTCNIPPITPSPPVGLVNASFQAGTVIKDCSAASLSFCFYVKSSDPTSIIAVTDNHTKSTPGAVITYTNINKDSVRGCFSWTPSSADTGLKVLTVTAKDSTCRAPGITVPQTFSYPLQIRFAPPPGVTPSYNYCQYAVATSLTASGQNLKWYTTATGGTGSPLAPTPNTTIPGITIWYVSQTPTGSCESARAPLTVTVTAKPLPPVAASAITYCTGSIAIALTATGTNLKWYSQATGGIGNTTAPTPNTSTAGTFKWYVSQTVNGCESDRDSITVTVISGTTPPAAPTNIEYCEGDVATPLTATGVNLLWYTSVTGGTGSSVAPTPNTSIIGDTYYYVSQKNGVCETPRAVVRVTVYKKLMPDFSGVPDSVCQYQSITINAPGGTPSTASFIWSVGAGNTVTGNSPGPFIIKFNKSGVQKIVLNIINGPCSTSDSFTIFVKTAPNAFFNLKANVCVGETAIVNSITQLDNARYFWTLDMRHVFDSVYKEQYTLLWDTTGTSRLELILIAPNGCSSLPHDQDITIHKTEADIADFSRPYFCIGDTIVLTTTNGRDYIYEWSPEPVFLTNASSSVSVFVQQPRFIFLKVYDKWNCSSYDTAFINAEACCDLKLPDAFTPNGDGVNDRFHVLTLGHHIIQTFIVKNRWGQTVFSTTNESEGWDGTFKGTMQDPDTYFYILRYRCENGVIFEKRGDVTLIR